MVPPVSGYPTPVAFQMLSLPSWPHGIFVCSMENPPRLFSFRGFIFGAVRIWFSIIQMSNGQSRSCAVCYYRPSFAIRSGVLYYVQTLIFLVQIISDFSL